MGIVHVAIYDAAVAIDGGYRPYVETPTAPADTSPEAAIATAAYDTLTGLQPQLGSRPDDPRQRLRRVPGGRSRTTPATAEADGIAVGGQVAEAVLALRVGDGRGCSTTLARPRSARTWARRLAAQHHGPVLGPVPPRHAAARAPSASQFRPGGPNALQSRKYADDFNQVKELGRVDSTSRTPEQTNAGALLDRPRHPAVERRPARPRAAHGLDLVQTARMLAMAHVAGGDAMIACFDAKYHYWFWRPYQAIHLADTDDNPDTVADPTGNRSERRRTSPSTRPRTPATAPPSSRRSMPSSAPTRSRSRSRAGRPA